MFHRPHPRVSLHCGDEQITKQSHKDECDIHRILSQYQRTGILTHVQTSRPTYADLPDTTDYQTALNTLMEAEDAFASLPSAIRDHFGHDPAQFLGAFSDPKQHDQLRSWGLLKPLPSPSPAPAPASQEGA